MLLQQSCNLVGTPESVVNLAVLGLSYGRELDYNQVRNVQILRLLLESNLLFSLLNFVESIVLLRTLTAMPHASFKVQSSL